MFMYEYNNWEYYLLRVYRIKCSEIGGKLKQFGMVILLRESATDRPFRCLFNYSWLTPWQFSISCGSLSQPGILLLKHLNWKAYRCIIYYDAIDKAVLMPRANATNTFMARIGNTEKSIKMQSN